MADPSPLETGELTPEAYAHFIGQIELVRIWLKSAQVASYHEPDAPDRIAIGIESNEQWEGQATGFQVRQTYRLNFDHDDRRLADIAVEFALEFDSKLPMNDSLFTVFSEINLPLNTWPYLREYVSTTLGRMGWIPVTLPALKRGTRSASVTRGNSTETAKPPRRGKTSRRKAQA